MSSTQRAEHERRQLLEARARRIRPFRLEPAPSPWRLSGMGPTLLSLARPTGHRDRPPASAIDDRVATVLHLEPGSLADAAARKVAANPLAGIPLRTLAALGGAADTIGAAGRVTSLDQARTNLRDLAEDTAVAVTGPALLLNAAVAPELAPQKPSASLWRLVGLQAANLAAARLAHRNRQP